MCAVWKRRKIIIHPHLKIVNCINESGNSNPALKSYWDYICMKERDLLANIQYKAIKSSPLLGPILGIFSVENIARLSVFMFQTSDNSQLCIDSQNSSQ